MQTCARTLSRGPLRLALAGLVVASPVTMTANCTVPRGGVLTQSPQGGTPSIVGASVTLTESTGRQPNGKPCIFN